METIVFVVLALANWRLASLLSREGGPSDILHTIRYRIGVRYDEYNIAYGTNVVSSGAICMWCNSVWIGLFQALAYTLSPQPTVMVNVVFALSAAAILLEKVITGGE